MSKELKPCLNPACGWSVLIDGGDQWYNKNRFFIECKNPECGCCRVGDTVREKCIERWNALPRALVWTTEPPTIEGFYWVKRKNTGMLHVVRVMEIREELSVFMPGSEIDGYLHWYTQWAGPIPEPQEPRP